MDTGPHKTVLTLVYVILVCCKYHGITDITGDPGVNMLY